MIPPYRTLHGPLRPEWLNLRTRMFAAERAREPWRMKSSTELRREALAWRLAGDREMSYLLRNAAAEVEHEARLDAIIDTREAKRGIPAWFMDFIAGLTWNPYEPNYELAWPQWRIDALDAELAAAGRTRADLLPWTFVDMDRPADPQREVEVEG